MAWCHGPRFNDRFKKVQGETGTKEETGTGEEAKNLSGAGGDEWQIEKKNRSGGGGEKYKWREGK